MRPNNLVYLSIAILLLSACNGGRTSAKADAQSTSAATTTAPYRQTGSWIMLHYAIDFEGTGISDDMAELVKAGRASVGKKEFGGPLCLSAEVAAKDDLNARLQEAIRFGPEWKIVRSALAADGKVDFAATMEDPAQGKASMTITGQITPTTTDLLVTTDSWQPAPGKGHIHTVLKQENTRKGDCTPGQDVWQ
jgi:hypothetical protein